ncbi:MAG: alpha/beta hydrolase [Piscirickettsiaceae bacterium]|nr:MAG: alpha/beta hydrolase [Piscirickettsiaceae bacterium]PCI69485.1 MAG: alpha/beta hydrolase [Piscirickettsiaceae bacterium]
MSFVQLDNVNIHYQQQGSGDTAIIFIHGNFGSWRHWLPCLNDLPSNYIAYAPELRGCGDTQATDDGYNIETMADDILQFANRLNIDAFHLVGHSLGGAVAQELASLAGNRIITLTLVAPAPAEGMPSLQKISTKESPFSARNIWQFFDNIGLRKKIHRASFKKTMPSLRNNKAYLEMIVEDALKMDIKAFDGFLKTLKAWNGIRHLTGFQFPVLIMHGQLDSVIPLQPLKNMQQRISDCQFHTFTNIGHSPPLESPGTFNRLLFAFLKGTHRIPSDISTQPIVKIGIIKSITTKLKSIFKKTS